MKLTITGDKSMNQQRIIPLLFLLLCTIPIQHSFAQENQEGEIAMKLTINTEDLITALASIRLEYDVNCNDELSVQSHLLIQAQGDGIELTASDSEVTIQTTVSCTVTEDGQVVVLSKHMTEIIDKLPKDNQIDISLSNEREDLKILCAEGVYKLRTFPVNDFPAMPTLHGSTLSIEDQSLHSLINKTIFAVDDDDVGKGINGLFFNIHKDKSEIAATNGHVVFTLAEFKYNSSLDNCSFVLPKKSAANIIKHISDTSVVTIYMDANKDMNPKKKYISYIQVNGDNTKLTSKVFDAGYYPDYQHLLRQETSAGIKIHRTRLIKGLERVSILSNPELYRVKLSIQSDKLILSCETDYLGEAFEEIDIEHTDEATNIDIYLNAKYLIDGLSHMCDDVVKMEYSSNLMPVVFTSIPEENHVFVISPMKLMD